MATPSSDYNPMIVPAGAAAVLEAAVKSSLATVLRALVERGHVHPFLVDKFRHPANRVFLDKALLNAATVWQLAVVAQWALNAEGLREFSSQWVQCLPSQPLLALLEQMEPALRFREYTSLKDYRREVIHSYPKVSPEELAQLQGADWQHVIAAPSGRAAEQDCPSLSAFVKQGDIEHSLLRHYLLPSLRKALRAGVPPLHERYELNGRDRALVCSVPVVLGQLQQEVYESCRKRVDVLIRHWVAEIRTQADSPELAALAALETIWEFRRAAAASDCRNPVENLIKGFTATIRNAFNHCVEVAAATARGSIMDVLVVDERYLLAALVSNGQLDNLARAYQVQAKAEPDPARRTAEGLLQCFVHAANAAERQHIQAHFQIDATRGCPALPAIGELHVVVVDLLLEFLLGQFGEQKLREAGNWYLQQARGSSPSRS